MWNGKPKDEKERHTQPEQKDHIQRSESKWFYLKRKYWCDCVSVV